MTKLSEMLQETTQFIPDKGVKEIDFDLILGLGSDELADEIEDAVMISYDEIPFLLISTVVGHAGKSAYGSLTGKKVLAIQGRFHHYEDHPMQTVTYPVRVIARLGAHSVTVINACGDISESFVPGSLMLITDHTNFTGGNLLIGSNEDAMGPRFPDMSQAYTLDYQATIRAVTGKLSLDLKKGVYMGYSEPTYETSAEIRMSRAIGADAIGMSTIPEVIAAAHSGLRVLGTLYITNLAAGIQANLSHEEVIETTQRAKQSFKALVKGTLTLS